MYYTDKFNFYEFIFIINELKKKLMKLNTINIKNN